MNLKILISRLKKILKKPDEKQDRIMLFASYAETLVRGGTSVKTKISGNSMYPTIKDNEEIVIVPRMLQDINVEDIIAYHKFSHITVHRVIGKAFKKGKMCFYTKGDNNPEPDSYVVLEDEVFGVVEETGL